MIISDHHKTIKNAIKGMFPSTSHGLCTFHSKQNLRKFQNEKVTTIYDNESKVYRKSRFKKALSQLKKIHLMAYTYLVETWVEKWLHGYSHVPHYEFMTTNIVENINSCLRHARKLLICTLVEFVYDMVGRWFYNKCNVAFA